MRMSSPQKSDETCSQDSVHASSQFAASVALEDTASSMCHTGQLLGSSTTMSSVAPNSAFVRRRTPSRAHSISLGLRRTLSPLGVLVVQLAEQVAENAMSGIG